MKNDRTACNVWDTSRPEVAMSTDTNPANDRVLDEVNHADRDYDGATCPYCREGVDRLPAHLRNSECGSA